MTSKIIQCIATQVGLSGAYDIAPDGVLLLDIRRRLKPDQRSKLAYELRQIAMAIEH
jgi:hypothetical protein